MFCPIKLRISCKKKMAIAMVLPGFNSLRRSVTPILPWMDHSLNRSLSKNEESLSIRSLSFFCNIRHRIPFILALCLTVRWLQMSLEQLRLVKTLATFGIINVTDSVSISFSQLIHL